MIVVFNCRGVRSEQLYEFFRRGRESIVWLQLAWVELCKIELENSFNGDANELMRVSLYRNLTIA